MGGWVVDTTVNIVFCFGPRLGLKTEVLAQAEQLNYPLPHPLVNPFVYGGPKMNQNFFDDYISIISGKILAGL